MDSCNGHEASSGAIDISNMEKSCNQYHVCSFIDGDGIGGIKLINCCNNNYQASGYGELSYSLDV